MKTPEQIVEALTEGFNTKDKAVIDAFADGVSADGRLLTTDGITLEKLGVGGGPIAKWEGRKVYSESDRPQVRSDMVILRALKKALPRNAWGNLG